MATSSFITPLVRERAMHYAMEHIRKFYNRRYVTYAGETVPPSSEVRNFFKVTPTKLTFGVCRIASEVVL